ncbi:Gfo/Idh/MocA family oxidoreductase [Desulfotomaculum defluvii]
MTLTIGKNIAVIGAGYWGKNLVRNLHNIGALKLVCDPNVKLLNQYREQYQGIETTSSYDEVLNNDSIKGVVIAAPAELHYKLAYQALEKDKDVYVEKPLCLSEVEGEKLCRFAEKQQKILMVGHLLHYHPAVHKIKEIVTSGQLGRLNNIYSNRLNLGKFRSEENVLWSFAPHDVSVILNLVGKMPNKVSAVGNATLQNGIQDTVNVQMQFDNINAGIFISWLHPFKEQRMVITGDRGMLVFDDVSKGQKLKLYKEPVKWNSTTPVPAPSEPLVVEISTDEPLRSECMAFIKAMETRVAPVTDGWEGLRVLKILNACQDSLQNQGRWVNFCSRSASDKSYFAHATAIIDEPCQIGSNTKIWHYSHIMNDCTIGQKCNIGQNVVISSDVILGNNVKIQNNVSVYTGIICEDDVFLGPSMVFTNVKTPRSHVSRKDEYAQTLIRRGASVGANSTIVCGIEIGKYALIGAGSVVTKDVPDHALMVGNPAKQIGWVCQCGERLEPGKTCERCGHVLRIS